MEEAVLVPLPRQRHAAMLPAQRGLTSSFDSPQETKTTHQNQSTILVHSHKPKQRGQQALQLVAFKHSS